MAPRASRAPAGQPRTPRADANSGAPMAAAVVRNSRRLFMCALPSPLSGRLLRPSRLRGTGPPSPQAVNEPIEPKGAAAVGDEDDGERGRLHQVLVDDEVAPFGGRRVEVAHAGGMQAGEEEE